MPRKHHPHSAPLLLPAAALAAGIAVGQAFGSEYAWLATLMAGVALSLALWRTKRLQALVVTASFAALGATVASHHARRLRVAWPHEATTFQAVVASQPVERRQMVAMDLLLTDSHRRLKAWMASDSLSRRLAMGDGLVVNSKITPPTSLSGSNFDYQRFLETNGFSGTTFIAAGQWQRHDTPLASLPRAERARLRFLGWRTGLLRRLKLAGLKGQEYAVVAAMALGDKSALDGDLRQTYNVSGASHVLALSGMHIGIIFGLLSMLSYRSRLRTVAVLTAVPALWAYVLLVGMPPSVVRAAAMATLYTLVSLRGEQRQPLAVLAFAAIVMLLANPWSLFDVGFQLSFMAMLAILAIGPVIEAIVPSPYRRSHPLVAALWGMAVVSVAAQMGVAPLVAYYFGRFSTYFLITNFIVVPAATLVLYLSLAALIVPSMAWLLAMVVEGLNSALTLIAQLPMASIEGLQPTSMQTLAAYVLAAALTALLAMTQRHRQHKRLPRHRFKPLT